MSPLLNLVVAASGVPRQAASGKLAVLIRFEFYHPTPVRNVPFLTLLRCAVRAFCDSIGPMSDGGAGTPAIGRSRSSRSSTNYAIRGGLEGRRRLNLLHRVMWPTTAPLLRRARVSRGMACLDMGCGGGHVALALARRVGPSGRVLGVDIDPVNVEHARRQAARRRIAHAAFRQASIYDFAEEHAYDRIYVRFLLTHLPDREAAVRILARALRPGGVLIVEDTDFIGSFSYPRCPAFDRYVELYREVVRRRGGDPEVGPKLRGLFVHAGLEPVHVALVQPCHYDHEGKALHVSTFRNIADAVVSENLAPRAELDQSLSELAAFTSDPATLLTLPRVFQTCARRALTRLLLLLHPHPRALRAAPLPLLMEDVPLDLFYWHTALPARHDSSLQGFGLCELFTTRCALYRTFQTQLPV